MLRRSLVLLSLLFLGCSAQECRNTRADLFFLVDSSGSVAESGFQFTRDFIKDFAKGFDIGPDNVLVGAATFANEAVFAISLDGYEDFESLATAIQNIVFTRGGSSHGKGIELVVEQAFAPLNGGRAGVPKYLIFVTDGTANDRNHLELQLERLRQTDINVIAVGVGSGVDVPQVKQISPTRNFFADSYGTLDTLRETITKSVCDELPPLTTEAPRASHVCEANFTENFLCGQSVSCNCTLQSGGSSGFTATWFKGATNLNTDVLTLTYNRNDPEVEYTCEAVSGTDRTFGSSLKITTENPCSPPQMMGLY